MATAARTITAHLDTSAEIATTIPSTAAIQSASRLRRALSQPPGPGSTACDDDSLNTRSTVPRWCRYPGLPVAPQRALRSVGFLALVEQAVQRRAGTGDVCPERPLGQDRFHQRRAGEVVRRELGEVARPLDLGEAVEQ